MAAEPDKWQIRQARVIAEEEGIAFKAALSRVMGSAPRVSVKKETPAA